MGTRAYAENVANIIDPQRKIFGDRILSRNESGSMTAKNLKRLFPIDTKMVVIIDDRADVWHWISNLVKVNVFEFFVGIGDINSSFLPKRSELEGAKSLAPRMERIPSRQSNSTSDSDSASSVVSPASTAPTTPPSANGETSAVEQMISMAGSQDEKSIQEKTEEQEQTIKEQLDDRPMLRKQKELEDLAKEEEAKASPAVEAATQMLAENGEDTDTTPPSEAVHHKYRQNLLANDDTELFHLEQSLRSIHHAYYEERDRMAMGDKGGRVAELRPGQDKKRPLSGLENIPDAALVMDSLKLKVLAGVHLVFSGVVPLGVDIYSHDAALWAKSFGATVSENITKKTTHIIASPERRTAKVRQAAKRAGRIAIVSQSWLHACFAQWKKLDENPYRIHSDVSTNGAGALPESFEARDFVQDFVLSSSDEEAAQTEEEVEDAETPTGRTNGLSLQIDTDADELALYAPSLDRQDSSPTESEMNDNWDEVNAELADFMGSEGEESDTDSVRSESSTATTTPSSQRKRKQDDLESEGEVEGSRLQKRKKEALERTTSLTHLIVPSSDSKSTTGNVTADPGGDGTVVAVGKDADDDHDDDDDEDGGGGDDELDLEAALTAEMEKQSVEDGVEEGKGEEG
jgi:RNA polymerase II subunit A-like phosphatase